MDTIIQLGSFVFKDLEIPEKINFGGDQQLVQHDLIGGSRVIDALGQNNMDISWSGLILGSDSLSRAQQLNQLRVSGQQLKFSWFNLHYTVVILHFSANTERFYQVSYDITLKVVSDNNTPVSSQNLVGFNEAIQGDFSLANKLAQQLGNNDINQAMILLNNQIQNVSTFNGASQSVITPVLNATNNVIATVNNAIATPAENLFGMNT